VSVLTATKSILQNKQLPAHSVLIKIYSGIIRFLCDSMAFFVVHCTECEVL